MNSETQTLLAQYIESGSETAFGELVSRYINLVYSTALRRTEGDGHLAKDVSQTVFIDLARKAAGLSQNVMLGGWLHQRTCHVAATLMRSERRRQHRERQAMESNHQQDHTPSNLAQVASMLDDCIAQLASEERAVLLLRFFEQLDFRSVGKAVGVSEDAARMRTNRALEKLQGVLKARGAAFSAGSLATALAAGSVTAAPAGLATAITGSALASFAVASSSTSMLVNFFAMTKLKIAAVSALVLAGVTAPVALHSVHNRELRASSDSLRAQSQELEDLRAENERLSNLVVQAQGNPPLPAAEKLELLRLRGQVSVLKRAAEKTVPAAAATTEQPKETAAQITPEDDVKQAGIAKMNYTGNWLLAFMLFSQENQNQFPTNFDQALPFLPDAAKAEHTLAPNESLPSKPQFGLTPGHFEIVYRGSIADVKSPASTIVLREKEPCQLADGSWVRAYGFADGHSEIHKAVDGNFEPWERERMIIKPQNPY